MEKIRIHPAQNYFLLASVLLLFFVYQISHYEVRYISKKIRAKDNALYAQYLANYFGQQLNAENVTPELTGLSQVLSEFAQFKYINYAKLVTADGSAILISVDEEETLASLQANQSDRSNEANPVVARSPLDLVVGGAETGQAEALYLEYEYRDVTYRDSDEALIASFAQKRLAMDIARTVMSLLFLHYWVFRPLRKIAAFINRDREAGYKLLLRSKGHGELRRVIDGLNQKGLEINYQLRKLADQNEYLEQSVSERTQALKTAIELTEEASAAKSTFLARMSHELRTPINAIAGYCYLLKQSDLTKQQKGHLEKVEQGTDILLREINEVLDLSRIESGKLELNPSDYKIREGFETCFQMVAIRAAQKEVDFGCDIPAIFPSQIKADGKRLEQIMLNLLTNAIKFTDEGFVSLTVSVDKEYEPDVELRITVEDSGCGIPDEALLKVFNEFEQASESVYEQYGGSGLGLTICKSFTEMMGGTIDVSSVEGEGTIFIVTIPIKVLAWEEKQLKATANLNGHILLMDDKTWFCDKVDYELTAAGFDVDVLDTSDDSIQTLAEGDDQDIIIFNWPFKGCIDSLKFSDSKANATFHKTQKLVFARLSDFDEVDTAFESFGQYSIVPKPILYGDLIDVVGDSADYSREIKDKGFSDRYVHRNLSGATTRIKWHSMRVLVVEDNLSNQELLIEILGLQNTKADIANHGQEALDILQEHPDRYDLILMDINMPVMDGFTATETIKAHPDLNHIPVVMLSANVFSADREKSLSCGASAYLQKPVNVKELEAVLEKIARASDMNRASELDETSSSGGDEAVGLEAALARLDNNKTLLVKLLYSFYSRNQNAFTELEQCLNHADRDGATNIAHSIKGLVLSIGLNRLAKKFSVLEAVLKDYETRLSDILENLPELGAEYEQLFEHLEQIDWQPLNTSPATVEAEYCEYVMEELANLFDAIEGQKCVA